MARKLFLGLFVAVAMMSVGCSKDSATESTKLDGNWKATNPTRVISVSGKDWTFSEEGVEVVKGVWSSPKELVVPSTNRITITATQMKGSDGAWHSIPSQYESVKTNKVDCELTAKSVVLKNAELHTSGLWGTIEGTYMKQ